MRELNCQDLVSPGGAAVKMPMLTSAGNVFARSRSGVEQSSAKSGAGSIRRVELSLYSDFSTAQHPASSGAELCEFCSPWQLLSVRQARNSKPGTASKRQCMLMPSQAMADMTNRMFFNDRTTSIDARKAGYVQSNLLLGLSVLLSTPKSKALCTAGFMPICANPTAFFCRVLSAR